MRFPQHILLAGLASVLTAGVSNAQAFNNGFIGNCSGTVGAITNDDASCGVAGANGVVTTSGLVGSTSYGWVTTRGANGNNAGLNSVSGSTNSSLWSYSFFAAAGTTISFRFNYVTSDGNGFEDYGYGMLDDKLLVTARTDESGNTVPGLGMPATEYVGAPTGAVNAQQTTWDALGIWSNTCWSDGCGFTGWLTAQYTIASEGMHTLAFGVSNLNDEVWDTGMAFDFALGTGAKLDIIDPNTGDNIFGEELSGGCEKEFEQEEEDGIITTKIEIGSCEGDDALEFDDKYTGDLAVISQDLPGTPSTTVPEPATIVLVAAGMAGIVAVRRRS